MTSNGSSPRVPEPPPSGRLPANVKLLGVASLLNDVASEMIYPLLPDFLFHVLGGDNRHLGVIEGVADSAGSLLKLWSGGWSDRAGKRKPFIVCGYSVPALARPLIALATAPWQLFALRVLDRLGKGLRTAPRDALIADSTLPAYRGRAFGFHRALDHLGAAIGPLLALGFLWLWPGELRWLFALAVVPGVAVTLLVLWGLKERRGNVQETTRFQLALPAGGRFRVFLLALVLFTLGNSSDMFLLVRSGELGVPTESLPLLWCAFHVVKSLANLAAGRVTDAIGPRPLIAVGWLLYGGVYLAFALAAAAWHAWALFLVYGVVYSLTEPAEKTLVARLVGPEQKGLAFGWFNFAIGLAALPSSIVFGWLYEFLGPLAAFGWGAALAVAAAALLPFVGERSELPSESGV